MEQPLSTVRALVPLLIVAALIVAGCGFEPDEAHPAPRTPLLPPTSEALGAPTALTPTTAAAAPPPAPDTTEPTEPAGEPQADGDGEQTGETDASVHEPQRLQIVVLRELAHSPTAFTQGLEISDGRLYESTGSRADRLSSLRELDRITGEVIRLHEITEDVFAEGLTFVDDRIYQLTWKAGVALVWDPEPEEPTEVERFTYGGQGWGLCYNGRVLVMSDGSAEVHFRDPVTFERVGNPVLVTLEGKELPSLNELECFRDPLISNLVYANVWQTDMIVQIDIITGRVLAVADASELGRPRPDDPNAVLNGIAWDPATETFLITGKDWPQMYEVYFEAADAAGDDPSPRDP